MENIIIDRKDLKTEIFSLMDKVRFQLEANPNVDDFLDRTDIFDNWESLLPEKEYPIFVMAVLNNIRRDSIIETILNAIIDQKTSSNSNISSNSKQNKFRSHFGEHPFN